jgi:hypothetical protein
MPVGDDFTIPIEGSHVPAGAKATAVSAAQQPLAGVSQAPKGIGAVSSNSTAKVIKSSLDAGRKTQFKRPVNINGQGATRCRLFHCKVAESPMEHMENQINDWLDSEQIEVKHVGHVVGMMEGKHTEQNVVVMVWY